MLFIIWNMAVTKDHHSRLGKLALRGPPTFSYPNVSVPPNVSESPNGLTRLRGKPGNSRCQRQPVPIA